MSSLTPGTRLGPFEILADLGAGGMGEVYLARDSKLNRDVAIKVLLPAIANDPDRLARFSREAQVLASLNHPNIAAIYGLEDAGDVRALVMELVEGPTLADRIAQGPIPLGDALPIAKQIAEALEAAHEQGIIHRDLKPANIKVREDGKVKVLDFGLAKAMDPAGASSANVMNSPTISLHATQAGIILGTAAYMAPEQARGKVVDRRADIWAFGAVVYEMLTGRRAFEGDDMSLTLAAVMMKEPDWDALPSALPPVVRTYLRRCLAKDPRDRIRDIGDVRLALEGAFESPTSVPVAAPAAVTRAAPLTAVAWAAAGLCAVALALVLVFWVPWTRTYPAAALRINGELGADGSLVNGGGANAVLSPDGKLLALVARKAPSDPPQLYLRRLDQLQASLLAGTEGAFNPFFSPDGQWIAFFAQAKLRKIAVTGGAVVTLCDAPDGRGGSWGEDGVIVFQPDTGPVTPLMRVLSAGGAPERLGALAQGEALQRWPQVLPGGKGVLFSSLGNQAGFEAADLVVQPLPSGPRKVIQRGGYYGRYVKSGHLVYMHQGTLFAAPFNLGRLEVTGPAVPAIEAVASTVGGGGTQFSASDTGAVVYLPGRTVINGAPMDWVDHTGKTSPLRAAVSDWSNPAFSPDGKQIAIDISDGTQADVWTYDWSRDTLTRLTFDKADDQRPVWSPDGRRVVFASRRGDQHAFNLYWQRADGTGEVQRLTDSKNNQWPTSFHPNGKILTYFERNGNNFDVMMLPIEGSEAAGWKPGKPTAFLNAPYTELNGQFSPDGRWIAYLSDESGRFELFVRPFPGPGGKWQISTGGADDPVWSRAKHELLYSSPTDTRIMMAPYSTDGESFQADKPSVWATAQFASRPRMPSRDIDLHPDGERFAIAPANANSLGKQDRIVFIFNFFDELRRIAPATK